MSLREHWTVEPRIGDLYSTPICYQKEGFQKEIERIGSPYKENLHHLISDSSSPRNAKQLSTFSLYKRFMKKCEKKLAKVKSHIPEFPALEVVGTRLPSNRADEETKSCSSEPVMSQVVNSEAVECGWDKSEQGPRAELSTTNLFLHGKPGEHVSSLVTLKNTGSTSLYYQWHQQAPISLLVQENKPSKCMVYDGDDHPRRASCFHLVPTAGCIVPGESKDFYIEFHPSFSGSFMETWLLWFSPKLIIPLQELHLHGAAIAPEDENSILQRKLLQQCLDIRQQTRGLEEFFCEIIEKAIKQVQVTFKKAPDFVISSEGFDFMRSNIECFEQTPLYYNPPVFAQFLDLALEIHTKVQANIEVDSSFSEANSSPISSTEHTWDLSVSSLILSLDKIAANENWKEMMRQRASYLQLLAAIPPHPNAILCTSMYKMLTKIASEIEEVMEEKDIRSISEVSSTIELEEGILNFDRGVVNSLGSSPSKQVFGSADVGQNSVKLAGSSPPKQANVGQVDSVKTSGSGPLRQGLGNANVRQTDSLKGNSTKQVNASVKDGGIAKVSDNAILEPGNSGEEGIPTCEETVRRMLEKGVAEQFWHNVEGALAKLVPVVQKRIEWCMAEGDEDSASWLSLWFTRLSHALAH